MIKNTQLKKQQIEVKILELVVITYILLVGTVHKMDWLIIGLASIGIMTIASAVGYLFFRWLNGPGNRKYKKRKK